MNYTNIKTTEQLEDGVLYKFSVLKDILKSKGLPYSIFTIRDKETWKCNDYKCGKRNTHEVDVCARCGGSVTPPLIQSPRTAISGDGFGHRRYTKEDIEKIVEIFSKRR